MPTSTFWRTMMVSHTLTDNDCHAWTCRHNMLSWLARQRDWRPHLSCPKFRKHNHLCASPYGKLRCGAYYTASRKSTRVQLRTVPLIRPRVPQV